MSVQFLSSAGEVAQLGQSISACSCLASCEFCPLSLLSEARMFCAQALCLSLLLFQPEVGSSYGRHSSTSHRLPTVDRSTSHRLLTVDVGPHSSTSHRLSAVDVDPPQCTFSHSASLSTPVLFVKCSVQGTLRTIDPASQLLLLFLFFR